MPGLLQPMGHPRLVPLLHWRPDESMLEKHGPRSVLVVDDDPDMRHVLSDFLIRSGYRVIEAANGEDGIFATESEPIDAVILDKEMPGMNGLDVLSVLRHRRPNLPIIFITAFGGRDDADESRRRGALFYIEKPFRVATIVEAVQAILDNPASSPGDAPGQAEVS